MYRDGASGMWRAVHNAPLNNGVTPASSQNGAAIDLQGNPLAAWCDSHGSGTLVTLTTSNRLADTFTDARRTCAGARVAVAPGSGERYVAFQNTGNGNRLTVLRRGAGWEEVTFGGSSGIIDNQAQNFVLAVTPAGRPMVAFEYGSGVRVMEYLPGSNDVDGTPNDGWVYIGNANVALNTTGGFDFAISAQGVPHLAFGTSQGLRVLRYEGGAWNMVGGGPARSRSAARVSLAFDATGAPYLGFVDGTYGQLLHFTSAGQEPAKWQAYQGAQQFSGGADDFDLAVAPNGTLWVAYAGAFSGDGAYAMRLVVTP